MYGIASGEEHRLRYIRPWKAEDVTKATTDKQSALHIPGLAESPGGRQYLDEVTGGVPRMLRIVKNEWIKENKFNPTISSEAKILNAIKEVEESQTSHGIDEVNATFQSLNPQKQQTFINYLGRIILPINYKGAPTRRDARLYDKGFIYHDTKDKVLRVVNSVARRCLLDLYLEETQKDNVVEVRYQSSKCLFHQFT